MFVVFLLGLAVSTEPAAEDSNEVVLYPQDDKNDIIIDDVTSEPEFKAEEEAESDPLQEVEIELGTGVKHKLIQAFKDTLEEAIYEMSKEDEEEESNVDDEVTDIEIIDSENMTVVEETQDDQEIEGTKDNEQDDSPITIDNTIEVEQKDDTGSEIEKEDDEKTEEDQNDDKDETSEETETEEIVPDVTVQTFEIIPAPTPTEMIVLHEELPERNPYRYDNHGENAPTQESAYIPPSFVDYQVDNEDDGAGTPDPSIKRPVSAQVVWATVTILAVCIVSVIGLIAVCNRPRARDGYDMGLTTHMDV